MKEKLDKYIKKNQLFNKQDKLLIAISSGLDSVALSYLLNKLKYKIYLAHCNFGLRDKQSDEDELFVKRLAIDWGVKCFVKKFNTKEFAQQNKISIQMAARNLRYNWFEKIRKENNFDFILTAHHRDDDIETFFINLIRGTSIKGMLGIPSKRERIIRPFLFAKKKEIYDFSQQNKIKFREDSSNKDEKYLRNKIRLKLIPLLKDMNPSISKIIKQEKEYLTSISQIYYSEVENKRTEIVKKEKDFFIISIEALKKLDAVKIYMYEFLKPFGFSNVYDIVQAISGQSGKQFFSASHRLTVDRKQLIIQKNTKNEKIELEIKESKKQLQFPLQLKFKTSSNPNIEKDKNIAVLDYHKLHFPLILRKWQEGDSFIPIGMKGEKKLSDFFIDNKIPIPDKEKIWVLCSSSEIVWVVGYRISENFKILETTKKAYIAQLRNK